MERVASHHPAKHVVFQSVERFFTSIYNVSKFILHHFYFFNSFYENLMDKDKIDDNITCSASLFNFYHKQLYKKLKEMPAGTRVATYHCLNNKIPPEYHLVETKVETLLQFWIKVL